MTLRGIPVGSLDVVVNALVSTSGVQVTSGMY